MTTSAIDAKNKLVGFQGDFTFDERVVTFQSEPVQKAGLTGGNWNVSGNVLPGTGPIRTLRISAYSNDFTPLSGSGTLFELRMTRVSKAAQGTQLIWAAPPDQFIFIDADLKTQKPGNAAPGSVLGKVKGQGRWIHVPRECAMRSRGENPSHHVQRSLHSYATRHHNGKMRSFSVALMLAGGAAAVRGQSALDGFDPNANGVIHVVVVQPDGKILIGGDFTTLSPNGGAAVTRNRIARLNADGTLDTAFDPNANGTVFSIALQADGKILAGGFFTSIGGQTRNRIARLDATTGLADSFDPNASDGV